MVGAAAAPDREDRYRFVLARVGLDGVDTASWTFSAAANAGGGTW